MPVNGTEIETAETTPESNDPTTITISLIEDDTEEIHDGHDEGNCGDDCSEIEAIEEESNELNCNSQYKCELCDFISKERPDVVNHITACHNNEYMHTLRNQMDQQQRIQPATENQNVKRKKLELSSSPSTSKSSTKKENTLKKKYVDNTLHKCFYCDYASTKKHLVFNHIRTAHD